MAEPMFPITFALLLLPWAFNISYSTFTYNLPNPDYDLGIMMQALVLY